MKAKAVFFDRDGVLDEDVGYLYKIEDLRWLDGAKEAVAYLTALGYKIFIVTNQSGIARGYYTVAEMDKLHEYMLGELKASGGKVEKVYYCPHYKEGSVKEYSIDCDCRKPKPGMILRAFREFDLDKEHSFLIGDGARDVEAAETAGIRGYRFKGGSLLAFVKECLKKEAAY